MSSAVEVSVGSQSKMMPSPLPMTTVEPAMAPALNRRSSTPSLARRSARKPTASSLAKSVCGDPALGLDAEDAVDVAVGAALDLDGVVLLVDGARAQHDALACGLGRDLGAALLDELGQREAQLAQALVADRRDLEDAVAALLEVGRDEVGELAALGHVDLVEGDELRALEQRLLALGNRVGGELGEDDVEVADRVAARARAWRSRARAGARCSARRGAGTRGRGPCPRWRPR